MDSARGFPSNDFDDARMGVAQGVNSKAAEKIEVFFAARIINVAAAPMREDNRLALVRGHEKLIRIAKNRIRFRCARMRLLRRSDSGTGFLFCVELAHYAAERAS